jgi:hypothetical protein
MPDVNTGDLKDFHFKPKPPAKKKPKAVTTKALTNEDIDRARDQENEPDETEQSE